MKTFKQHLNALEKKRKLEKSTSPKDNVMTVYVHGKHASNKKSTLPKDNVMSVYVHGKHAAKSNKDNTMPVYVHGKHASNKINEEADTGSEGSNDLHKWLDNQENDANDGQDVNSLHEELLDHYYMGLYKHPDLEPIAKYTRRSSVLNKALIKAHKSGTSNIGERLNKQRDGINRAITSIPAPKNYYTYTGLGVNPKNLMDERNVVHSPAFLSSSLSALTAYGFTQDLDRETGQTPTKAGSETERHILRILVKKGQTNGAYVGDHSVHPDEQEYLHRSGLNLKINPNPKILIRWNGQKTHIWDAESVED